MIINKKCRLCNSVNREIINLGNSPAANHFVSKVQTTVDSFPLIVDFCDQCSGFQLRHCLDKEQLYSHYSYLTPDTASLNDHYENIVDFLTANNYLSKDMDFYFKNHNKCPQCQQYINKITICFHINNIMFIVSSNC